MNRQGMTLVEVMVAMLILMVGVLALASSMGFVSLQVMAADIRTERTAARQQAIEQLFAEDFDALLDASKGSGATVNDYTIWWDVTDIGWALKNVEVYTDGPGFHSGRRQPSVVDTLTVRIARPNK